MLLFATLWYKSFWILESTFIYHNFYFITGINPSKLIVTLKGEAKDAQSSSAGMYVLGPNPVNGKPHWLQDPGSNAIWNLKNSKFWLIGLQDDLGGSRSVSIFSTDEVASPQEATNWQYYDGKEWITSDDIFVDTFVKPGAYIIYIPSQRGCREVVRYEYFVGIIPVFSTF